MRLRLFTFTFATALAAAFVLSGCAVDHATGPSSPAMSSSSAPSHALLSSLTATTTVTPLRRTTALPSNISASATIGALGGTLSLPAAGLTVVIPPLAITTPTKITVTALAGSNVAYEFAPHGIKFVVPLVATQSLKGTEAQTGGLIDPLSLFAGYFPDANRVTSVSELLNVNVDVVAQTSVLTIWHFSGYIIATGRSGEDF